MTLGLAILTVSPSWGVLTVITIYVSIIPACLYLQALVEIAVVAGFISYTRFCSSQNRHQLEIPGGSDKACLNCISLFVYLLHSRLLDFAHPATCSSVGALMGNHNIS
jgi:hypothetical protein